MVPAMPPADPDTYHRRREAETEPMLEVPAELSPALRLVFEALFREIRENRREVAGLRDDVAAVQSRLADGRVEFAKINLRLDNIGEREVQAAKPAWWKPILVSAAVTTPIAALAVFLVKGMAAALGH